MIYFVEDDNSIRKLVLYTLSSQGMECQGFTRPSEFWSAMGKKTARPCDAGHYASRGGRHFYAAPAKSLSGN